MMDREEAKAILNIIKQTDIDFFISDGQGRFLGNRHNAQFMTIFGRLWEGEFFYGVTGEICGKKGQIDSRTSSDEAILACISKMLQLGILIEKRDIHFPTAEHFYLDDN